jgi:branched-chain amino acid transport system substrate-binding protein
MEGDMKRLSLIAVVTGAAALLAVGFGGGRSSSTSASKGPISIGALTSLTGNFTPWGVQVRDGMALAVKQINAKGGVKGRKLNLVVGDDQSTPNAGIDAFRRLTEQDHVVAVGGLISSDVALATARLAEQAQVPMFLVKAGATEILSSSSRYTFRTCLPAAAEVATPILQYARKRHVTRVGAIIADYAWGQAIKSSLEKVFAKAKNIKLDVQVAPVPTKDFTTYLRALSSFKAQLIVATGHPPGSGAILAQSGQLGLSVPVAGAYTPFSLVAKAAGQAAYRRWADFKCENVASSGYKKLARQFLRAYPNDTFFEDDALAGYAIVKIVAQAIGKVGDNPKKIAAYVHAHTFAVPGYTFPLSWTKWGEMKRARIAFDLLTAGPAARGLNTGGSWYPKQLSVSKPLTPFRP